MDFFGSQIRINVYITIVLTLNALFIMYVLPENTRPHCNYKIIGGGGGGGGGEANEISFNLSI